LHGEVYINRAAHRFAVQSLKASTTARQGNGARKTIPISMPQNAPCRNPIPGWLASRSISGFSVPTGWLTMAAA
jgi:hypothetical protein